jgi:hypothetical protein
MWARIQAFFVKLFGKTEAPKPLPPGYPPVVNQVPVVTAPVAKITLDYAAYRNLTPYQISTQTFPNGLPVGWDWEIWAAAAGRPNPMTHTNTGMKIEPMPAWEDPDNLVDSGEMDLMPGETKPITLTRPGMLSWAAHRPQYQGPCNLHIGTQMTEGAYMNAELQPGTYNLFYVTGPSQGLRVALRQR